MITDEMLRNAAARSNEIYVSCFESTYDAERQHEFSAKFQRKIEKLKRKVVHPYFYGSLKRVASVILAIAVSISVWLAVDVKAREAFFGWIKEVYETYFVYRYEGETSDDATPKEYQLTWIPDGYTELFTDETLGTITVVYADANNTWLRFSYSYDPDKLSWSFNTLDVAIKQIENGYTAELFIPEDLNTPSSIAWITDEGVAFHISAQLTEDDLIKAAKSVREK